jgi:hypothetical protein
MSKPERRASDKLPDFIFARAASVEQDYAYTLVGILLTPFPRGRDLSERDSAEIRKIIQRLKGDARRDPDWDEVSAWRNGKKPPDAVEGSFPDAVLRARAKGCIFLAVWDDDFFRIDETYLVESMARDEPTGRPN